MKPHDNTDPWSQGQKQVHYSAPGWLSKMALIITVPLRLVFGALGILLGGAAALDRAAGNQQTQIKGTGRAINDNDQEFEFNFNGTLNNDDNPLSGK